MIFRLLLLGLACLISCGKNPAANPDLDIVALRVEVFPTEVVEIQINRSDTAYESNFSHFIHVQDTTESGIRNPCAFYPHYYNDSLAEQFSRAVSNLDKRSLDTLLHALDFKAFAAEKGRDNVLDGTS